MPPPTCERCGEPLPEGARFCPNCAYPVEAPPPEERKVVTVVFVDLVGSTKLSAQIDPERYREVIAAFYRTVSEELESLRGRAYNFAGDAVVGVFGIPKVHDDDALRAVRAGLALVERIERIGQSHGLPVPLRARVGINTGPVAVGTESSEQGLLFGATVNFAARLQQGADPGTVQVSERTWLLTRTQVEYLAPRTVDAKGFDDDARGWPVVALAPGSTRRTIPIVDRKRELRLLHDTFEGVLETRRGHLVSLFGEPGIGKSRVAEEFLAGLSDEVKVLLGRASPFEEEVTFGPLAQMLLQELGERADASPARLLARLEELAATCCPADEIEQTVARLALALGIGDEDARGEERRYPVAEIRAGLLAILTGLSASGPVVLVFEDAHQAQASMLDLIEQVVREAKHIPLLVLCIARYDLLDDRPEWAGGLGDSLTLYLEAMSFDDSTQLAQEAGEHLDLATAERVARHAGGNPFFIVETTGMLRHADHHLPADTDSFPEGLLPPTVQAVIASRIDHLPAAARDLVRTASVFARSSFDVSELALIAEPNEKTLEVLENEELLVHDPERPSQWGFRHGLVRDVAYESLPKRERERLHLLVADGLSDPEKVARHPRSIAYHLERAARAGLDLDPADRTIAERAVEALAHAGDLALDGSDTRPAADLYGRAIALCGPSRTWGTREASILSALGEALYWQGEFERSAVALERALELAPERPVVRAQASRFLGDIELSIRGRADRAEELFDAALAAARELGDPWTTARTLLVAAWAPRHRGDYDTARAMFEEALQIARDNADGDAWSEARALAALSALASDTGGEDESLALASQGLAVAETTRDRFSIATAREAVASALRRMGRFDEALGYADAAVEGFRELGARWELASVLVTRGIVHRMTGSPEEALRDLREAYRLCRELKDRSFVHWAAGWLARTWADAGEPSRARRVLAETASIDDDADARSGEWRAAVDAEILLAEGDREGALAKAKEGLAYLLQAGETREAAAQVWWIARVFGEDEAGGYEEAEGARKLLEQLHWGQALAAAELVARR